MIKKTLVLMALFGALIFTLIFTPSATGQVGAAPLTSAFTNTLGGPITNGATSLLIVSNGTVGATVTNISSAWVRIFRGRGLGVFLSAATTNLAVATSTNVTARFNLGTVYNVNVGGVITYYTNFTTTKPLSFTITLNNSTNVTGFTNFPDSALDNANYIQLADFVVGHTNSVWVSNCIWSVFP